MTSRSRSAFRSYRFPDAVIALGIRWYLRFRFSYADVVELLAERGVKGDASTVYDWGRAFTPHFMAAAQAHRSPIGHRWHVIFEYMEVFYHRQRRHSALGYFSPAEYERRHSIKSGRMQTV